MVVLALTLVAFWGSADGARQDGFVPLPKVRARDSVDWATVGEDKGGMRYSTLSQINRDGAEAPKLTDLKGSGALEEDSATVLILNQPNFGEQSPEGMKATLNVAKARYGFPGVTAELLLSKGNQTFYPWDPIVAAKIWERLSQAA